MQILLNLKKSLNNIFIYQGRGLKKTITLEFKSD